MTARRYRPTLACAPGAYRPLLPVPGTGPRPFWPPTTAESVLEKFPYQALNPPADAYVVPDIWGGVLLGLADEWRAGAWRRLCSPRDRIRQTGVVTHAILREKHPPDEFARVAARLRCDLIVLGTRGGIGPFRMLLGRRLAEGVKRRAP